MSFNPLEENKFLKKIMDDSSLMPREEDFSGALGQVGQAGLSLALPGPLQDTARGRGHGAHSLLCPAFLQEKVLSQRE